MNILLLCIGLAIFCVYISPLFNSKFNIGNAYGIINGIIIAVTGLLYDKYINLLRLSFIKSLSTIYLLQLFTVLVTLLVIIRNSVKTAKNEEIIIVLGCRVKGKEPTKALLSRCNAAYEYMIINPQVNAILSGGQGKDEELSEAKCMQKILVSKGIDKNRLILEEKSTSTQENIFFSQRIINQKGIGTNVAIVTSEYHLYRAKIIAKKYGMNVGLIPAKSIKILRVPYYTREVFGIWKLILTNIKRKD